MEEDIKILEEYINEEEGALKIWQIDNIYECEKVREAIENLIKGYKELEEEVNKYEKQIDLEWVEENYIEKSKVREKIEELNDKMAEQVYIIKEFGEHKGNREKLTMYKDYRDAYAELLQEGDDK